MSTIVYFEMKGFSRFLTFNCISWKFLFSSRKIRK